MERTNARSLASDSLPEPVTLATVDVSFISLRLVLPALTACAAVDADLVLLVKPQFEVGKDRVGKGGVVRDPGLRAEAVRTVADAAGRLGWPAQQVATSPLPGPSGNVEFFLWLRRAEPGLAPEQIEAEVRRGSAAGEPDEKVGP
jgi:23S rRNA (cytidine1920-2'-O)/16S rRNA (cytidine1409-2'-O)-methyltransferase